MSEPHQEVSPYNLSPEREERYLSGVDPEIVDVLGKNDAIRVEIAAYNLGWIEGVLQQPNPYVLRHGSEPDLSFLKPDQAQRVMRAYRGESPTAEGGALRSAMNPLSAIKTTVSATRMIKLGSDADDRCFAKIKQVAEGIKIVTDKAESLPHTDRARSIEQVNQLSDLLTELGQYAEHFPNQESISAIKSVYDAAKRQLMTKMRGPVGPATLRQSADFMASTNAGIKKANHLSGILKSAIKLGHANYEMLRSIIEDEKIWFTLDLLNSAADAKAHLETAQQAGEIDNISGALAAESYLVAKIAQAEKVLQQIRPKAFNNKEVRRQLEDLRSSKLTAAERARRQSHEQQVSSDLSGRISASRDVLKGGSRLPARNGDNPKEIAERLRRLSKDQGDAGPATIEDNGIIIAMITGKFDVFSRTLDEVQTGANEEVLSIIERQRPQVVKELRSFGLDDSMQRLRRLVEDPLTYEQLKSALSAGQLMKLELGIDKYFERQENQANTRQQSDLEDILTNGELYARLDWTVLPKGELELEKAAQEIVADANDRAVRGIPVQIDLERLNVLKNIKEDWGADRCYYARGTLSGRGKALIDGVERPDEYIVLVLQDIDQSGAVINEHAIAESPIARHNAMYIMRGDVSEFSWRDIYSLPKKDARAFGARAVRHTKGDGSGLVNVMTSRARYLLSCSSEEFSAIAFSGRRIRIAKKAGKLAASA